MLSCALNVTFAYTEVGLAPTTSVTTFRERLGHCPGIRPDNQAWANRQPRNYICLVNEQLNARLHSHKAGQ